MELLIGIDGGGSKTKIQCYDLSGNMVQEISVGTTDYHQIGVGGVVQTLKGAFGQLGVDLKNCLVGFGMPAFGENIEGDKKAVSEIRSAFPNTRISFENDVYCAWAGALAYSAGVAVVCGTGSMSVGCDKAGKLVRSGGWSEFFSDEGSGYWLGKKALELFAKQSDSRLPRGALYALMREHFNVKEDIEVIGIVHSEYASFRKKTASLQAVLHEAYKRGDETAAMAYSQAVEEVVLIVLGAVRQLDFGDDAVDISYIGGLFNEEELFLNPFKQGLNKHIKANVFAPKLSPCHGALLFAIDRYERNKLDVLRERFKSVYPYMAEES